MSTLEERIKEAIAARDCTQADLAAACGISPVSVNNWVSGRTKSLKAVTAQRAATFLKVNFVWLTEGRGPRDVEDRDKHHVAEQDAKYVSLSADVSRTPSMPTSAEEGTGKTALDFAAIDAALSGVLALYGMTLDEYVLARMEAQRSISRGPTMPSAVDIPRTSRSRKKETGT